jgi:hypothetical protein
VPGTLIANSRRGFRLRALAVALHCSAAAAVATAAGFPASETIFPATTRAWVSIADFRGMQERFDKSPYGQLIADPAMKAFVEQIREQISKNGKQRLAKLGLTLEDLEKVPGGELAAAAIEVEGGRLATVLLVDTTGHEDDAKAVQASYDNPKRYDHLKLFPKTNWELTKWDRQDTLGFLSCCGLVVVVLVFFKFVLTIGS